jgi:2-polyprenyl-3-methyl-5-hydroxy-6-metoxy-1,4-benzoquinol methylase
MKTENKIKSLLIELGISTEDSIVSYFPKVRDRDDIAVLKCRKSGVIFLSRSDHMDITHYSEKEYFKYWGAQDRKTALLNSLEDTQRRFEQFKYIIANKKWIDIGTGAGGILDILSPLTIETVAVEPQEQARKSLADLGYKVYPLVEDVKENDFDIVTLFHVLEHFTHPIETLRSIKNKMSKGGKIIIEVPHAKDFLISFLENNAFKAFTFWSEHLVLHTRESLSVFLKAAGFSNIVIKGFQRYPLANHLYWLANSKPGGHIVWQQLRTAELENAYSNMLSSIDKTDTLICIAENL